MFAPMVPKQASVGKVDRSYIRVSAAWLGAETIASATVVNDDGLVTIGATDIAANEIGFMRTGVTAGVAVIHISYVTSGGRGDCKSIRLTVIEC